MAKEGRLPDFSGIVSSGFKVSFLKSFGEGYMKHKH
jgi:hypothetical protein